MKVVVFGGSGFLGSHVADALTDAGHGVTVYDISPSKYLRTSQKMLVGDILDAKKVSAAVKGCDIVYNFAGIADIAEAAKLPVDTVTCNILGNTIILDACRHHRVKRFVFASTLYVYSKAGGFYRSTKQACELLIENYEETFGVPYTILRFGSLYGPRANESNFIHRIINQALTEGKITRMGNGDELREYIHVYDAARGSVEILDREFENQHVIITGNQQMRIRDLLFMIREMLDNKIVVEFVKPDKQTHYELTPYSFAPRVGRRLTNKTYLDLNQGLLDMIYTLYKRVTPIPTSRGTIGGRRGRK